MAKQLFIPDKIKVGFQNRQDTYTKKLAYVIYYDNKGVLRKEKSWQGWRDQKIDPVEFSNEPVSGFVLNKGVGGQRQSYGWNARNEYIRVYDPRDFEFEISVSNLLFILRECDCSKGKGLEGKFAYAWDGTELVLLPEISTDYQESKAFTDLQVTHINPKELIPGASYLTKRQKVWTYLGRFNYYNPVEKKETAAKVTKRHIFWNGKAFEVPSSLRLLAQLQSDVITPDYADLVDKYNKSANGSAIKELILKAAGGHIDPWYAKDPNSNSFLICRNSENRVSVSWKICLQNGILVYENCPHDRWRDKVSYDDYRHRSYWHRYSVAARAYDSGLTWIEPTGKVLYAKMESGEEYRVSSYYWGGTPELR